MHSAQGAVQQYGYQATFPLLLNVSGQPTYFMALKDSSSLVKMYAMVNVQQYQIVATGSSVMECESAYIALLQENNIEVDESVLVDESLRFEARGIVAEIRSAVLDGTTYYYFRLEEDPTYYRISAATCENAIVVNVGDGSHHLRFLGGDWWNPQCRPHRLKQSSRDSASCTVSFL